MKYAKVKFIGLAILTGLILSVYTLHCYKCQSYRQSDTSRLVNFGMAMHMYADAHGGALPFSLVEFAEGNHGVHPGRAYVCPSQPDREISLAYIASGKIDYVYVGGGLTIISKTEHRTGVRTGGQITCPKWHNDNPEAHKTVIMHTKPGLLNGYITFLFLDGRVECVKSHDAKMTASENGWIYGWSEKPKGETGSVLAFDIMA